MRAGLTQGAKPGAERLCAGGVDLMQVKDASVGGYVIFALEISRCAAAEFAAMRAELNAAIAPDGALQAIGRSRRKLVFEWP